MHMSEEQKKPTMPEVDLSALDDAIEDIDITQEIEDAADTAALEAQIDEIAAERDDFRDKFMRALADAENSRKRALEAAGEEQRAASAALLEGVELTLRELINVFKKHGIEPIQPEVGEKFDPQLHQAMFEAPVPNTKAGDIIQVSQAGFMLHDRLLRPAQVGVSSTPG
jgi:molecular chaperone GrpE